jgi:hypothetical protein
MASVRDSVYLSGWEYNRLLQKDPTKPRNSALPAAILWTGAHQLWMFKTIYCTKESYENEIEATDRLGWVNGKVLRDLYKREIFKTVDWSGLPVEAKDSLRNARKDALSILSERRVKNAIASGDAATLELAKLTLIKPILNHYGCFESGAPNSVTNWIPLAQATHPDVKGGRKAAEREVNRRRFAQERIDYLASHVVPSPDVCRPPGTGISQTAREWQQHIQDTVEKPMIPSLLAGDGEFSGPHGFLPYLRRLERVKEAYEATNKQLAQDWDANKDNLLRLRDAASRYLWDDLHGYWLPRLLDPDDESAGKDFDRWIKRATRIPPIARYLHGKATTIVVGAFGGPVLTGALAHAGIPLPDAVATASLATSASLAAKAHLDQLGRLAIFFQEARRQTSQH